MKLSRRSGWAIAIGMAGVLIIFCSKPPEEKVQTTPPNRVQIPQSQVHTGEIETERSSIPWRGSDTPLFESDNPYPRDIGKVRLGMTSSQIKALGIELDGNPKMPQYGASFSVIKTEA